MKTNKEDIIYPLNGCIKLTSKGKSTRTWIAGENFTTGRRGGTYIKELGEEA